LQALCEDFAARSAGFSQTYSHNSAQELLNARDQSLSEQLESTKLQRDNLIAPTIAEIEKLKTAVYLRHSAIVDSFKGWVLSVTDRLPEAQALRGQLLEAAEAERLREGSLGRVMDLVVKTAEDFETRKSMRRGSGSGGL
jgi:hypothetical protein